MKTYILSSISVLIGIGFLSTNALAQEGFFLGSTSIKKSMTDSDTINLGSCRSRRRQNKNVAAIKLKVRQNDLELDRIRVKFGDQDMQELSVRDLFLEGTSSRWIDLAGDLRCLEQITLVGQTIGSRFGGQARIDVYGSKVAPGPTGPRRLKKFRLNAQNERRPIHLRNCQTSQQRNLTDMQIRVKSGRAQLNSIVVRYGNNQTETFHFRSQAFRRGEETRWFPLDVRHGKRCVKSVTVNGYSSSRPAAAIAIRGR